VLKTLLTSVPPQTVISLPLQIAVCNTRPTGALAVLVAVQLSVLGLYLPPVLKKVRFSFHPPQITISVPLQIAVCKLRAVGTLLVLVAVQLFMAGLYLPPVFKRLTPSDPPQTIISLPADTAV
jgi:hypothetical protein